MKYKEYTKQIWDQINQTLKSLPAGTPRVAAFDADGTLWDIDLGENFFNYLIDNQLVELPEDPWGHYRGLKAKNPNEAYLWLAQICAGKSYSELQSWCAKAVESVKPIPVFEEQKKLVQLLLNNNVQVFVITASVTWSVQAGVHLLGIDPKNVIGVETEIQNGVVSKIQKGPITYREGKVAGLLQRTNNVLPFFASGNTEGDLELLKSATHLRLAVSAASRDDRLYKTESQLQEIAKASGWLQHRYIFSE